MKKLARTISPLIIEIIKGKIMEIFLKWGMNLQKWRNYKNAKSWRHSKSAKSWKKSRNVMHFRIITTLKGRLYWSTWNRWSNTIPGLKLQTASKCELNNNEHYFECNSWKYYSLCRKTQLGCILKFHYILFLLISY